MLGGNLSSALGEQGRGSQVKACDLLFCRSELVHQALGLSSEMETISPCLCQGSDEAGREGCLYWGGSRALCSPSLGTALTPAVSSNLCCAGMWHS